MAKNDIKIDCSTCKSEGSMVSTKIAKFNFIARLIGGIIVIPSIIGVIFALMMFFSTGQATTEIMATEALDPAAQAGAAVGASIGFGMSLFVGGSSLVSGLIGWLLLMKRKVYKCIQCGFILDRA